MGKFNKMGNWILSKEMGADVKSQNCLAYVEDIAATPDQIPKDKQWLVVGSNGEFEKSTTLRLDLLEEDLLHAKASLADFDGEPSGSGGGDEEEYDPLLALDGPNV